MPRNDRMKLDDRRKAALPARRRPKAPARRLKTPGADLPWSIRERVAGLDVAALQARGQPLLALRRRAVGEAVGHGVAARGGLQAVVADRRRGRHRLLDVAGLENLPFLISVGRPDAGEAIGHQFDAYRECVRLSAAGALLGLVHLVEDAEQILHVMAD